MSDVVKVQDLEDIYDAINYKAVFLANMLRSQKLAPAFDRLKQEYVKNRAKGILDGTEELLNSYNRLAGNLQINLRKMACLAAAFTQCKDFPVIVGVAERKFPTAKSFIAHLLGLNFDKTDKKQILLYGLPVLFLDKFISMLRSINDPQQQIQLFRAAFGYDTIQGTPNPGNQVEY